MTGLTPTVQVDFPGLRRLLGELGPMSREVRSEFRSALVAGGREIFRDAQAGASWSSRIPRAMRLLVRTSGPRTGIFIRVDASVAPHARPFEGLADRRPTFRHPVFGDRERWVEQDERPFLSPAASRGRAELQRSAMEAARQAARSRGFR